MSVFILVQLLAVAAALLLFAGLRLYSAAPDHWYLLRKFRFSAPARRLGRKLLWAAAGFVLLSACSINPHAPATVALIPGVVAAALVLVALRLCYDSVRLYDHGIAGISLFGLRRYISWDQIHSVELNRTTEALCLRSATTRPVYLSVDLHNAHTLTGCLHQQVQVSCQALEQWHRLPDSRRSHHDSQRTLIRFAPWLALTGLMLCAGCLMQVSPPLLDSLKVMISGLLLGLPLAVQAVMGEHQLRLLQSALAQMLCSSAAMMLIQNQMQGDIRGWLVLFYLALMIGSAGLTIVLARLRYGAV